MAKIKLKCDQCGGNIVLDDSHEIGTCESCYAQFVIKQDQIIQKITQNITKHVYGYEGKDIGELIKDGYQLRRLGIVKKQMPNSERRSALNQDVGRLGLVMHRREETEPDIYRWFLHIVKHMSWHLPKSRNWIHILI